MPCPGKLALQEESGASGDEAIQLVRQPPLNSRDRHFYHMSSLLSRNAAYFFVIIGTRLQ